MERDRHDHEEYYKVLHMTLPERVKYAMKQGYETSLANSERLKEYYKLLSPEAQLIADHVVELICGIPLRTIADSTQIATIIQCTERNDPFRRRNVEEMIE